MFWGSRTDKETMDLPEQSLWQFDMTEEKK